jgi:hypothetical protein
MTVSTLRLPPPPPPPPPARHPHALVIVRSDHCAQLGTATNPRPLPFTHGFTRHYLAKAELLGRDLCHLWHLRELSCRVAGRASGATRLPQTWP